MPEVEPIVTEDGFLADPETGEIVGYTEHKPDDTDTESVVNGTLERRAYLMARREGLIAQMRALFAGIQDRFETQINAVDRQVVFLDGQFEALWRDYALKRIDFTKAKNLKLPFATLAFRSLPQKIEAKDPNASTWLLENAPAAVQVEFDLSAIEQQNPELIESIKKIIDAGASVHYKVLVSKIPDEILDKLPEDLFDYRPAGEQKFYVQHFKEVKEPKE